MVISEVITEAYIYACNYRLLLNVIKPPIANWRGERGSTQGSDIENNRTISLRATHDENHTTTKVAKDSAIATPDTNRGRAKPSLWFQPPKVRD
ncbi:hypothetical protein PVK06_002393 [Gossypium arboreum]|uniref:Uncharacterized protein n=1 Tax=Gossypium arboreum TaxID=29729 RepID=A0ABR0R4K8_GOSAR|nr:hypothetical protein PVK06_002393 [Gossypium arboreum]